MSVKMYIIPPQGDLLLFTGRREIYIKAICEKVKFSSCDLCNNRDTCNLLKTYSSLIAVQTNDNGEINTA